MKSVVTAGTFDGIHRGHHVLLDYLQSEAIRHQARKVVITFDRHPLELIAPARAPRMLMTADDRDARLRAAGMEVFRVEFDERLRGLTAREWIREMQQRFDATEIVMGYDHTFGNDGLQLDYSDYRELGQQLGVEIAKAPEVDGVSSSAIRRLVSAGEIEKAVEMLGRPYALSGIVTHGKHLGTQLGFPTANLTVSKRLAIPQRGVYAGVAVLPETDIFGRNKRMPAVINIGVRPTVDRDGAESIEAHIPGYSGDLYDKALTLEFNHRIRDERHFESIDALRSAIRHDIEMIR